MHEITAQQLTQELRIHGQLMALHARALACLCECLGMNAENSWRVCRNEPIAYNDNHYDKTMQKWGLVNEKGDPMI